MGKINPGNKRAVRKMIRTAIKFQNSRTLFSCKDCCLCGDTGCDLDEKNIAVWSQRMPHQLPNCFTFDPIDSAFAGCLELMNALGIDFHAADYGWPTIVGRIVARTNQYGYLIGIKQSNLDKYGS